MAPKKATSAKRSAGDEARAPAAKKARADPLFAGIAEAVNLAEETHSADCRSMLVAMIPGAFAITAENRDEHQRRAVAMIGEVIEGVRERMHQAIEAQDAKVAEIQGSKAGLEGKAQDAGAVVAKANDVLEAKSSALALVSTDVLDRKSAFSAAVEAQKAGDGASDSIASSKGQYEAVVAEELKSVQDGESQTKKQSEKIISFAKKLSGMDESLLKAAPSSCLKKVDARSTFDNMVIESLAKCLRDHVAHLTAELEAAKPGIEERAAVVHAAQAALEAAKAAQQAAATEATTAQASHREAKAGLKAAEAAVKDFEPTLAAAQEAATEKKDSLYQFQTWNVNCFEMSRDKERKPDPTAEALAAEAPNALPQSSADSTAASPGRVGTAPSPGCAQKPVELP